MNLLPKLISLFLQYPDEELARELTGMEAVINDLEPESARGACREYMDYLRRTPLLRIQEEYTRTFDLNPSMCLNLSHHKWGEDRERSSALASLSRLYRSAGFEMSTGELPDYLPLVLEFLAVCPQGAAEAIMSDYKKEIGELAERLKRDGSTYGPLLGLAAEVFSR